ncbi:hypothetical protein Hanom_Chr13g01203191 [Helianthus anomalus]
MGVIRVDQAFVNRHLIPLFCFVFRSVQRLENLFLGQIPVCVGLIRSSWISSCGNGEGSCFRVNGVIRVLKAFWVVILLNSWPIRTDFIFHSTLCCYFLGNLSLFYFFVASLFGTSTILAASALLCGNLGFFMLWGCMCLGVIRKGIVIVIRTFCSSPKFFCCFVEHGNGNQSWLYWIFGFFSEPFFGLLLSQLSRVYCWEGWGGKYYKGRENGMERCRVGADMVKWDGVGIAEWWNIGTTGFNYVWEIIDSERQDWFGVDGVDLGRISLDDNSAWWEERLSGLICQNLKVEGMWYWRLMAWHYLVYWVGSEWFRTVKIGRMICNKKGERMVLDFLYAIMEIVRRMGRIILKRSVWYNRQNLSLRGLRFWWQLVICYFICRLGVGLDISFLYRENNVGWGTYRSRWLSDDKRLDVLKYMKILDRAAAREVNWIAARRMRTMKSCFSVAELFGFVCFMVRRFFCWFLFGSDKGLGFITLFVRSLVDRD